MMSASEAHAISLLCQGEAFRSTSEEQRQNISEQIKKISERGFFTFFYTKELYPDVEYELKANGYNVEKLYKDIGHGKEVVRIFEGINISW